MTTTATGLLCWRDSHPQEWQLASLHLLLHRSGLAPPTPCRSPGALRVLSAQPRSLVSVGRAAPPTAPRSEAHRWPLSRLLLRGLACRRAVERNVIARATDVSKRV